MPGKQEPPSSYRLRITLLEIKPGIWREIQVPSSIKLCCLHSAFQVVMGWRDSHFHRFEKEGQYWGIPEYNEIADESETKLIQLLNAEGESMIYLYDFGDNWRHQVVLDKIVKTPICVDGDRRCPPEDVGGASGYEEFLEVIFNPTHEEYQQKVRWAGGHFVDEFDVNAVNKKLSGMRWPVRHRW